MAHRESFVVETTGRGTHPITAPVRDITARAHIEVGLCTVFVHHTSASLFINENADDDVRSDLEAFFSRLCPDGDAIYRHTAEGPDDMPAHVRSVLTATSLSIPVHQGALDLGMWQGIFLWEHRHRPHRRRVSVTVI